MLVLEKKGFSFEGWQLGDEVYYKKHDSSEDYIKANIVGFQENSLSEFILIDCYDKDNIYSYNINISEIGSNEIVHYCESNKNQITWVNPKDLVLIKPYSDVLRYEYIKFDSYFVIKYIYQNLDVLKRGEFNDDDLNIHSYDSPEFINDIDKNFAEKSIIYANRIYLMGENKEEDDKPFLIKECYFNNFVSRIEELNIKYRDCFINITTELKDITDHIKTLKKEKQIQYIKTIKQILNI